MLYVIVHVVHFSNVIFLIFENADPKTSDSDALQIKLHVQIYI